MLTSMEAALRDFPNEKLRFLFHCCDGNTAPGALGDASGRRERFWALSDASDPVLSFEPEAKTSLFFLLKPLNLIES